MANGTGQNGTEHVTETKTEQNRTEYAQNAFSKSCRVDTIPERAISKV